MAWECKRSMQDRSAPWPAPCPQVVGICLTAAAVTAYMAWQWKSSAKPAPAPEDLPEPAADPAKPGHAAEATAEETPADEGSRRSRR